MTARAAALVLFSAAALASADESTAFEWEAMGTRMRLLVRGPDGAEAGARMFAAARAAVEGVEAETSAFRPESAVCRVSAAAGSGEWVATGPAFDAALDVALGVAAKSGGAFNPLVAPLMAARGFARGSVSEASDHAALRDLSALERRPGACRLARRGMALDLGGVAKGLGADRAAAAARAAATNEFLLDAGGNLVGRGAWDVGVRDPRGSAGAPPLRVFALPGGAAVSTSGNYERRAAAPGGTGVGHLFDPRTGLPAGGEVLQATALAPTAALADAWSTALFVLGPEAGRAALAGEPVAALWVLSAPDSALRFETGPRRLGQEPESGNETSSK